MIISILIPTRGRPHGLHKAVSSMVSRAAKPDRLEFLLRSDDDQPAMMPVIGPVLKAAGCQLLSREFTGPRGGGYRDVYKMYNLLAEQSIGGVLINWNDDVEMITDGWDDLLTIDCRHRVQFIRRDILPAADTTFPCTSRSVYEAMGHLAMQVHADDWMGHVARDAGVAVFRNDILFHHDRLNDQTSYDRDHGGYDVPGFNTDEMRALRAADVEKVRAADPRRQRA